MTTALAGVVAAGTDDSTALADFDTATGLADAVGLGLRLKLEPGLTLGEARTTAAAAAAGRAVDEQPVTANATPTANVMTNT